MSPAGALGRDFGLDLSQATWTEVAELLARAPEALVLLPVGATEAHGPHLPLSTDVVIAEGMAKRAARALGLKGHTVVRAPSLVYSVTHYAESFAGTTSIGEEAARAYVRDVCLGLGRAGFARVCLVNAHLEPAHIAVLGEAAAQASAAGLCPRPGAKERLKVAFADKTERRFARLLTEEFKRGACHAGAYETSLVLAERPELVHNDRREKLPPLPINLAHAMRDGLRTFEAAGAADAYFGDPARATAEEGEAIYALLCEFVLTVVEETWPGPA